MSSTDPTGNNMSQSVEHSQLPYQSQVAYQSQTANQSQLTYQSRSASQYERPHQTRQARRARRRAHPLWALYGLVILAALALVCFQIYRISTGKVQSAIPLQQSENTQLAEILESTTQPTPTITPIDDEHVNQILGMQVVSPAQLGGSDTRVTFRSLGGETVCTIALNLEQDVPELVPLPVNSNGETASGPGAVCAGIHNFISSDHLGSCSQGTLRASVLGVWSDNQSLGTCTDGSTTPLYQDAANNSANNTDGQRFNYQPLGLDQYTQIGQYACAFINAGVSCVDVTTGRGFNFTENIEYSFF